MEKYNVLDIIRGTTVDGPGFRTAIYLAGCRHKCPGCHNPGSWNPEAGRLMSIDEIMEVVEEEDFDVTLTGGDPLFSPVKLLPLLQRITEAHYKIWLYTGYTYEEILEREDLRAILPFLEAIVDGRFVEELKNPDLRFRGSSNQRIIML